MRIYRVIVIIAILTVLGFGVFRYRTARKDMPLCRGCNLIILSLDTFSGQHLPCNGYPRDTAPNLCAFAKKNLFFPHAYGNAVYTLPTYVSLFTGLYMSTHRINIPDADTKLPQDAPFLPSVLSNMGYRTIFVAADTDHMPKDRVYYRGIDTYLDEYRTSWDEALDRFIASTETGKKTFLFIHNYSIHAPFSDVEKPLLYTNDWYDWIIVDPKDATRVTPVFIEYLITALTNSIAEGAHDDALPLYKRYLEALKSASGDYGRQRRIALSNPVLLARYQDVYDPLLRIDLGNQRHLDFFKAVYDQKIHELDAGELSRFITRISDPKIRNTTLVVITSDHGEDFGEHGSIRHTTLYDSNTRVLLTMSVPGLNGRRIEEPVQTVDIMPTVLEFLGIPVPSGVEGISVLPAFSGYGLPPRVLMAERITERTLRLGRWKLFVDVRGGASVPTQMYDTYTDPYETNNVLFSHMSEARRMMKLGDSVIMKKP